MKHVLTDNFDDYNELLIDIDLPENHLSQYFNNLPEFAKKINETSNGPYKEFLSSEKYDRATCWGYEHECKKPLEINKCSGNHTGYVKSKEDQLKVFYAQADFGKFKLSDCKIADVYEHKKFSRLREATNKRANSLLRANIHH